MVVSRRSLIKATLLSGPAVLKSSRLLAQGLPQPNMQERGAMAQLANDFLKTYDIPGLSVAISIDGKPVYANAFGFADPDRGETLTPDHRFRIASVTKSFTSVGIFKLIEAGRLKLDSHAFGPGAIFEGEYVLPPDVDWLKQITIEHLLTHTCGGWQNDGSDPMFRHPEMSHRDLINWTLATFPLKTEPGKSFAYSNFGYCLLGRVIERLTSRPYAEFIRQNVHRPCGIGDMQIAGNTLADRVPNEVKYFGQDGRFTPYNMNVARMDSHGGWVATATDLINFIAQIDGMNGRAPLLRQQSFTVMTTGSSANPGYAKGFEVNAAKNLWHTGSLPGTETILVRTHRNFCWAALANARSKGANLDPLLWKMIGQVSSWKA